MGDEVWVMPPVEDSAGERFREELRGRRLRFPSCPRCKRWFVPPRSHCSRCLSRDLTWEDAPARGTLYAFTRQEIGLRFVKPDVLGIVQLGLPDGPARLLTRIDARLEELAIGMIVDLDFLDLGGGVVLHQFRPVRSAR
jgi:uncharacterized OB-fold protein